MMRTDESEDEQQKQQAPWKSDIEEATEHEVMSRKKQTPSDLLAKDALTGWVMDEPLKLKALDPLKVTVIWGVPIPTEREADYLLSQSVEPWKKVLFLLTNVPYLIMAISSMLLARVEHNALAFALYPMCESPITYWLCASLIAVSSLVLHSSQVRVGHWCCSPPRARVFHRRRVQDRFDVMDTACASMGVVAAVACQGVADIAPLLVVAIPVFALSLAAKKLKRWNLYLVLHGVWHIMSAGALWHVYVPKGGVIRHWLWQMGQQCC